MRHGLWAAALAGLVLMPPAGPALAQAFPGAGSTPCSQYINAARSSDILYHQASSWLLGYISGMDEILRSSGQASPVANLTGDQVLRAATAFCEANPTSTVANAANLWHAAPKDAAPKQAEAKKDDGNWIKLDLTAPARKPLLDRR
jgi:hypothetical protein